MVNISKAFDKISHSLKSYPPQAEPLRNQTKDQQLDTCFPEWKIPVSRPGRRDLDTVKVESGVPRCSFLRPNLFLNYINDISHGLNATVRLFADDTIAYLVIANSIECANLQKGIDKLSQLESTVLKYCSEEHLTLPPPIVAGVSSYDLSSWCYFKPQTHTYKQTLYEFA